jgi:hypothetical protein
MPFGYIYVLLDPRPPVAIRYVGQTTLPLDERLRLHLSPQKTRKRHPLAAWLRDLVRLDLTPQMIPVASGTSQPHLDELEIAFVASFAKAGADLVNTHGGGRGVHAPPLVQGQAAPAENTLGRALLRVAPPATYVHRDRRIAMIREMLREGRPAETVAEWASNTYPAIPGIADAKTWRVSRAEAMRLIAEARDQNALGDAQTAGAKRAERRAIFGLLLERAIARGTATSDKLAMEINDRMCRIDGAYDPSMVPAMNTTAMTLPEAVEAIEHAASLYELARSRGAIALPEAVIDVPPPPDDEENDENAVSSSGPSN